MSPLSGFGASTFGGAQQQPQQPSGGLFGSATTQQQQPAAGGFSFGQQPAAGGFGAPKPAGSTFGGFGANTANTGATNGGFTFGAANNTQQNQQQQPFGAPAQASGGLFGAKPATGGGLFGSTPQQPATGGLFGQQPQQNTGGLFGSGAATTTPAPVTQGTSNPPYQATVLQEKDAANNQANFAYQSITCMPQYRGMSLEELRVQDYEQGRKSGNGSASGAQPAAGFGFGQQNQTNTGFGAQPSGGFGQQQPQQSGGLFGQQNTNNSTGGLFGGAQQQQQQPATGGLFGQQNTTQPSGGLFGQQSTAQQPTSTGFSFGGANNQQQQQQPPASTGFSFGGAGAANNNAAKPGGLFGGFGSTPAQNNNTGTTGGFSFGQQNQQNQTQNQQGQPSTFGGTSGGFSFGANNAQKPGGLFGSSQPAATSSAPAFGGFGSSTSTAGAQANKPAFSFGGAGATSGGAFGSTTAPASGGLFGAQSSQPTTTSQPAPSGGLFGGFGQQNNQQQGQTGQTSTLGGFGTNTGTGGGLFGGSSASKPGGLFGNTTSQTAGQTGFGAGTSGGFSFGGASNNQQQNQQQKPGGFSFGSGATTGANAGGLFGSGATGGSGGLFGNSSTTGGSGGLFGASQSNNNQQSGGGGLFGGLGASQGTGSLFGASSNQAQQQSSLPPQGVGLTSDPYGTDALFKSMTGGSAVNQPALPFNVSTSAPPQQSGVNVLSASARSKPLPAPMLSPFRPNPKNSSRVVRLRGGTPARESSPSGNTSAFLGRSASPALNGARGLFNGLSDEVGSPSQENGLPAQAFLGRSSVKRLVLNDDGNSSWGRSSRAGTEGPNQSGPGPRDSIFGGRSGTVPPRAANSSRGVAFSPAFESGLKRREATVGADETFGDNSLQRSRSALFAETPSKANVADAQSRDLFSAKSLPEKEVSLEDVPNGAYHLSPSINALRRLGFSGLSRVEDFTVTRKGFGQVKFLSPVDLTGVKDLALIPGGIVQLREKEIWVYPQREDLEAGLDGMQKGYNSNPVPKAAEGEALNVPAAVVLEKCWPLDRATREPLKDPNHARVKQHIAKLQKKSETKFLDYDAVDGRWSFEVDHFSRYGLDSSDEDEEASAPPQQKGSDVRSRSALQRPKTSRDDEDVPPPHRRLQADNTRRRHPSDGPPSLTSDSSDGSDYEDDDRELASQASSEMHESELNFDAKESTPRRPTNNRRSMTPRAFQDSNTSARQGTPTQQQAWAAQVGVEPRRVQVMQASFFGGRAPGEQQLEEQLKARKPGLKVEDGNFKRKIGAATEAKTDKDEKQARSTFGQASLSTASKATKIAALPQLTDLAPLASKFTKVDLQDSITKGHEHVPLDASLALGRSFRVGWGPGGMLVHGGKVQGSLNLSSIDSQKQRSATDFSVLNTDIVGVFPKEKTGSERSKATKLLDIQLQCSDIASREASDTGNEPAASDLAACPSAAPRPDLRFGNFANHLDAADRDHESLLWKLGKALFDEIDLRLPAHASNDVVEAVTSLRRKEALSSWLSHAVATTVETECRSHVAANRRAAQTFTHLTGYQIEKACCTALDSGDLRLATLLAEIGGGDDETRACVSDQLVVWRNEGIDAHISTEHRRIYEVLAGNVTLSQGTLSRSVRDPADRVEDISIASGLDWKRAFGLHLWYGTSFDAPLSTAFEHYNSAVSSPAGGDTAPPLPPYREKAGLGSLRLREILRTNSYDCDALFNLIKIFSDPTFDLETALSPFGFGPVISDYRLPWHLYMLLSRVLRRRDFADREDLGVDVAERVQQTGVLLEGNSATADNLTSNYAHQLELQGQWTWAAFVLLHLELPASRAAAVKALLARKVEQFDDESIGFLTTKLHIPRTWMYEAQALAARFKDDRFGEFELLLQAKLFAQAHAVAVRYLAPEAIIRGDVEMILSLFSPFSEAYPAGRLAKDLTGWTTGGQLYVDYVACIQHLPYLIATAEAGSLDQHSSERLARLAPRVIELLDLVPTHLFPMAEKDAETQDLGQIVARSDMLASLHNLARVLSIRNLLDSETELQGGADAMGITPEVEHVQNAANDYMSLLLAEA